MKLRARILLTILLTTIAAAATTTGTPSRNESPLAVTIIRDCPPRLIIHPHPILAPAILEYHWTFDHDLNGNGVPDLVIGAPQHEQGRGVILILLDPLPPGRQSRRLPVNASTIAMQLRLPPDSPFIGFGANVAVIPAPDRDHPPDIQATAHPPDEDEHHITLRFAIDPPDRRHAAGE